MSELENFDYSNTIFDPSTRHESIDLSGLPSLKELSDLIIPIKNPELGHYCPGVVPLTGIHLEIAESLVSQCNDSDSTDMSLKFRHICFRAHRMDTVLGEYLIARRLPDRPWLLSECGYTGRIKQHILSSRLNRGGLIIVCGGPGQGKSTTSSSIVVERLIRVGGVAITIEDPVEILMHGRHRNGLCLQREVTKDTSFASCVRASMRAYPAQSQSILLIGEVRDSETAVLALRASVDGRLTIITTHAGDIPQAVQRVISLATPEIGEAQARSLFASGIRLIAHQKITAAKAADGEPKVQITSLFDTDEVVGAIRNRHTHLEQLNTYISIQESMIKAGTEIALRRY